MTKMRRGFTLIELLVVMTLLGLLLAIAVPRYFHVIDKGREQVRQQNLKTIHDALDKFAADRGRDARTLQELVETGYLKSVPVDPVTGSSERWRVVLDPNAKPDAGQPPGIRDVLVPEATTEAGGDGATAALPSPASR